MSDVLAKATLQAEGAAGDPITVQFNPASLQYSVQNQVVEQPNQGSAQAGASPAGRRKQYTTQSTAKLTLDLIFDTTDTGVNVCNLTLRIARLMMPQDTTTAEAEGSVPPKVIFQWGDYLFKGMIEQFRETVDFFHPSGVPLRSSVNLTLAAQDLQFEQGGDRSANTAASELPAAPGQNAQTLATQGGNPGAARGIAASNGQESLRFSRGPLVVGSSIRLKPPAGFASGAGGGFGAGAGFSAGVGVGARGSFGARASAGVAASAGAFAGLNASSGVGTHIRLNTSKLLPPAPTAGLSLGAGGVGAGATFSAAGQANVDGGGPARVELTADGQSLITFNAGRTS